MKENGQYFKFPKYLVDWEIFYMPGNLENSPNTFGGIAQMPGNLGNLKNLNVFFHYRKFFNACLGKELNLSHKTKFSLLFYSEEFHKYLGIMGLPQISGNLEKSPNTWQSGESRNSHFHQKYNCCPVMDNQSFYPVIVLL